MSPSLQGVWVSKLSLSPPPPHLQPAAPSPVEEAPPAKKPTRLAIGVEGGFDGGVEKVEYEEQLSVVAMPERTTVSLPNEQLPQKVEDILSLSTIF